MPIIGNHLDQHIGALAGQRHGLNIADLECTSPQAASGKSPLRKTEPPVTLRNLRRDQLSPVTSTTIPLNLRLPTLAAASGVPAPQVEYASSAPQKVLKRREESARCERRRQVPAHDAEHGLVPTHRAGLQSPGNGNGCARPPHSRAARQAEKTAALNVGARHPEPVVNPGKPHWRRWLIAGRSPIPLITLRRSTRLSSSSRYRSCAGSARTTAYLIAMQMPSSTNFRDRIEARHPIRSHVRFFFEIEHQASAGRLGKLAQASFQPGCVARISAGKRHHAGDSKAAQQFGLVHQPAVGRTRTRNNPEPIPFDPRLPSSSCSYSSRVKW